LNSSAAQSTKELWSCKGIAFSVAYVGLKGENSPEPKGLKKFTVTYSSVLELKPCFAFLANPFN